MIDLGVSGIGGPGGEEPDRAAVPWSGGRPWTGPDDANPEPDPRLAGTGADLAAALALVAGESVPASRIDITDVSATDLSATDLSASDLRERARARLVDLAVAAERVKAWAAAVQAQAAADLQAQFAADVQNQHVTEDRAPAASLSQRLRTFEIAGRATAACLSLALGISMRAADRMLAFGIGLAELPQLAVALSVGRLDEPQARTIQEQSSALPAPLRPRLVEAFVADPGDDEQRRKLLPELRDGSRPVWSVPPHQLRPLLHRRIAELAPEAIESAERTAELRRRVEHYASTPLQPAALLLHGPDHLLAAAYRRLDLQARAARRAGASETLDQLRFDAAVTALIGMTGPPTDLGAGRAAPISVDVVVSATTLLGLDEKLGTLRTPSGDVPISASLARRLAHDEAASWRRVLCHPATGVAVDVSGRYQPPPRMTAFCSVRDGHTSRFPTSSARTLELDHVVAYDHADPALGGQTTPANLACTGKRDHQAKTDRLITVTGDANDTLRYRTGAGHTYISRPHRYHDPGDDLDPGDDVAPGPEPPPDG